MKILYLIAIVIIIRYFLIKLKKPERRRELSGYINSILDPLGNSRSVVLYEKCRHIVQHYHIPLQSVSFYGDLADLFVETGKSIERDSIINKKIDSELDSNPDRLAPRLDVARIKIPDQYLPRNYKDTLSMIPPKLDTVAGDGVQIKETSENKFLIFP